MSIKTKEDQVLTIPEFFKKKEYNRAQDVITYLCDQYYVYGEPRCQMLTWASALRSAVSRDAMHFEEYYENPDYKGFFDLRHRTPWHQTERVLEKIFDDISEISCYQLDEKNEDVYEQFLQAIYESWKRAKKINFQRALSDKEEFYW